jgi:crotonobetaine/carnitine-CoA ligase
VELPPAQRTVAALLERQAARLEQRTFIRAPGAAPRSFRATRDSAAAWAGMLSAAGIAPGERVAAMCGNRIELLDLLLGCAWMGAIAVPLNTALRGAGLGHALSNSGARLLVIEPERAAQLRAVERPPTLERIWVLEGAGPSAGPPSAPPAQDWQPLPPPGSPVSAAALAPADPFAILYTSGTTGVAKGVVCPHGQFYWWGLINSEVLGIGEHDVLFTSLPLFHTNAINCLFQALVAGATYALAPRFSASRYWSSAREQGATVTYLLGAMVSMLLAQPAAPDDRAHDVRTALAPATPAPLHDRFRARFGVTLVDGYGSTETNHVIGVAGDPQRPGYLGRAHPEFEVQVVDDGDAPAPDGEAGELVVRPRQPFSMASGYHEMPQATVAAWRNLWFHTGDRVVREPDGWLRFVDRAKDAIRRRGENISSLEVERVLLEHPAVQAVAVFGVPSELAEDEVMATVVLEPGAGLEPLELVKHCEPRLAYFAIPRYIELAPALPLTENGKVRKADLRERGVGSSTWDRERSGYRLAR